MEVLQQSGFAQRRWTELGLTLGLLQPTLDVIEANHQRDVSRCLYECLTKWLYRADNVESVGPPTWDSLADGLYRINNNAVADTLIKTSKNYF